MWIWSQSGGSLWREGEDRPTAHGYAGCCKYKNKPEFQSKANKGPLPQGFYTIVRHSEDDKRGHGPFVLRLNPDPANEMFGRAGFLIHGDSIKNPGGASQGCIIVARDVRERIWNSGDHRLQVVAAYQVSEDNG